MAENISDSCFNHSFRAGTIVSSNPNASSGIVEVKNPSAQIAVSPEIWKFLQKYDEPKKTRRRRTPYPNHLKAKNNIK